MRRTLTLMASALVITASARAEVPLRRIDDAALVARLETEIKQHEAALDVDILCDVPQRAWSEPAYEVLRANRERVLIRLREQLAEALAQPPDDREFGRSMSVQGVLRIMMMLAPEEGLDQVIALHGHDDLRTGLLRAVRYAPIESVRARPELWELVADSLRHPNPKRTMAALSAAVYVDPERAAPRVRAAIAGVDNQRRMLHGLLREAFPSDEALALLISEADSAALGSIIRYMNDEDAAVRQRAADFLQRRGRSAAAYSSEIRRLEEEGASAVPRLIEIMQDGSASEYQRYKAMGLVIKYRGRDVPEVRETIIGMLRAPDVANETIRALAWRFRGTADSEVEALLLAIAHRAKEAHDAIEDDGTVEHRSERRSERREWQWRLTSAVEAMLVVSGQDAVGPASSLFDDESTMPIRLRWARRGMDDGTLVERFRASGLAPEASLDRCQWYDHNASPMDLAVDLLVTAGAGVRFDAEADEFPVRHDRLVRKFAAGSAGLLQPTAVDQIEVPAPGEQRGGHYRVRIVLNGRCYEFHANRGGDWYDTGAFVPAMNAMLADLGAPRRFYQFAMGQMLGFVCATPTQAAMIRDEFEIDLYDEPKTAPVDAARAFEDEVRRRLKGDAP